MDVLQVPQAIRQRFRETGPTTEIALLNRGHFTATLREDGIVVSNLGNTPFLPWAVFQEAICVLLRSGGTAELGNAMDAKLGDPGLALDSIEGHIAHVVYGKNPGESVFRRRAPVAAILVWAGLCTPIAGGLSLAR